MNQKWLKKIPKQVSVSRAQENEPMEASEAQEADQNPAGEAQDSNREPDSKRQRVVKNVDLENPPSDFGLRPSIFIYTTFKIREHVRRTYLLKGPCQPRQQEHEFPQKMCGTN